MERILATAVTLGLIATSVACSTMHSPTHRHTSAMDYLYPEGLTQASLPGDVELQLPVRVGIAFAPATHDWVDPLSESQRKELMGRVAAAFAADRAVDGIQIIPSHYLGPDGGFASLDQLRAAFGVDLVGLVSYDQRQFSEITTRSWLYVTVVGTLVVRGRKNETRTLMDTVVFDIPSRALLFHASGDSTVMDRSTPIEVDRERRLDSEKGFELATDEMIAALETALEDFKRRAREGTVRGPGTPRVTLVSTPEMERRGGIGGGALGWMEALAAAGLVLYGRRWMIRHPADG